MNRVEVDRLINNVIFQAQCFLEDPGNFILLVL